QRSESPVPSCVSMMSDFSMDRPIQFKAGDFNPDHRHFLIFLIVSAVHRVKQGRPESPVPSCVSMMSDFSMDRPIQFKAGDFNPDPRVQLQRPESPVPSCVSIKSDFSMDRPIQFGAGDFNPDHSPLSRCGDSRIMKKLYRCCSQGQSQQGDVHLFSQAVGVLFSSQSPSCQASCVHSVWQLRVTILKGSSIDTAVRDQDIFKPLPGQTRPIRTVLMKGVAGIGKTFSVQKFILDWAAGKDNQDFDFIFFLPFRELNLIKLKMSLQKLVQCFCPEIKSSDNVFDGHKVLFIFDGLDESRHPLNFQTNQRWSDVKRTTSVDMLLTNLIKGNFPVDTCIWITSRPAAAGLIPPELIGRVTEVQGFEDQQKEEYIRKKCKNRALAEKIVSHIKTLRSVYILCYVPVFCWIVVTVLEHTLEESSGANPTTLTDFYTYFLIVLLTAKEQTEMKENVFKSNQKAIMKLGKLAFNSLKKNIIVFYEEDLREYGIDLNNSSLYSGVCKEIFKQNSALFRKKVYCFLHLTVQEYFAALYVFGSYQNNNINPLKKTVLGVSWLGRISLFSLNEVALEGAIQSRTGHLDLFVRFLLGMEMENNQELLKGFLSHTKDHSSDIQKTAEFIKKLIRETSSPERCLNLFHCLSELKDKSLIDKFKVTLDKTKLSRQSLSPSQCSALTYFSLLSEKEIDVFNMREYATSEECVRRLLPVAKITKTLR
uniref:NACHT domain-containing protein n=1 Tax=Lepisosteus oculatus TaxID=7918 RepID=W5LWI2_LEPOC